MSELYSDGDLATALARVRWEALEIRVRGGDDPPTTS